LITPVENYWLSNPGVALSSEIKITFGRAGFDEHSIRE
jgi:hypothetical protein